MRECEKLIAHIFCTTPNSPDIIVLPELFAVGFSMNPSIAEKADGETSRWLKLMAERYNCAILASVPILEGGLIYNRALFTTSSSTEYYDKRHLFSYGKEPTVFTQGIRRTVVTYKEFNILIQICYDLRFPVWSRAKKLDYDIIINIANWPASRARVVEPMCRSRAIENQSYFLFVNRGGSDEESSYDGERYAFDFMGDSLTPVVNGDSYSIFEINSDKLREFRDKFRAWEDADEFVIY
jgi:Predicted amidohydrolase